MVGRYRERACVIIADGAWKKDGRRGNPKAGIGWSAKVDSNIIFTGNSMIKANNEEYYEGLAMSRVMQEARNRREESVIILPNQEILVQ